MNINFNDVQEQVTKPKMQPGIYEVEITGVTETTGTNGNPVIVMGFVTTDGQYEHQEKFSAKSEKSPGKENSALDITLSKLKHIATKVTTPEELATVTSMDDYNKLLTGKQLRMKFTGEERWYNGNIYVNAKVGFAPFAEALSTTPTKLTYNQNNSYDYKKAPVPATMPGITGGPLTLPTPQKPVTQF